jgi:hypothetical protein
MKILTKKQIYEGNNLLDNLMVGTYIGYFSYHNNYNAIMPVWEKIIGIIKSISSEYISVKCTIDITSVTIIIMKGSDIDLFSIRYSLNQYTLNSALFLAIVDFIKWCNENKELVK